MELDARLSSQMRVAERRGFLRSIAILFAHSGDSWFWLLGLGLVWFFGSPEWQRLAAGMALGILLTAVVVMMIKFSVRRRRPEGDWGNIYRSTDPHSFPSGHAARMMMLTVVSLGMGFNALGALLMVWALGVALARVSMGVHYLSDILAGMLLGILMGFVTLSLAPLIL